MMRNLSRALTVGTCLAAIVTMASPTPAHAAYDPDNLVPTLTESVVCWPTTIDGQIRVCQTDNGSVSVFMQSTISSNMASRIRDALDNSYDPIASLSVSYPVSPTYSGSAETDIIYQQGSVPIANAIAATGATMIQAPACMHVIKHTFASQRIRTLSIDTSRATKLGTPSDCTMALQPIQSLLTTHPSWDAW